MRTLCIIKGALQNAGLKEETVKVKLFISALIAALLVMGPVVHAATHDVIPDETHEFIECHGCINASATIEPSHTDCEPQKSTVYSVYTSRFTVNPLQ